MKRFGLLVILALSLPASARADFAAGMAAYEAGDYGRALREWRPLAEGDDVAAMRNVGQMYRLGLGVPKEPETAAKWYAKAAAKGFDRAQANLAALYLVGDGVPQDFKEAARLFEAAARQGHVLSQYNIAVLYERGLGVPQNDARALGWYNLAARAGHPEALQRLTQLVEKPAEPSPATGNPPPNADAPTPVAVTLPATTPAAPAEASTDAMSPARSDSPENSVPHVDLVGKIGRWLGFGEKSEPAPAKAEEVPTAPSTVAVANPAEPETFIEPDLQAPATSLPQVPEGRDDRMQRGLIEYQAHNYRRAMALWSPGAERGDPRSQFLVGRLYRNGEGMPRDRVKAWSWLHLAEKQGHAEAAALREQLEVEMSPTQLADARTLAENFRTRP